MSIESDSQSSSQHLSSSVSSLNQSKKASSEISKVYKHASQLYLTRRLAEAYQALLPVIEPPKPIDGRAREEEVFAPIATASTSQRIKTWSLYATLLNAIVDLEEEEGKNEFGQREYRDIVRRVQNGDVWEQVVRDGYRGREGTVDAEVVYNLSTLLLGQAPDQSTNQSRLENYLSSNSQLDLDFSTNLSNSLSNGQRHHMSGTNTPKDLSSRIKIFELFTLHVLPRNNEWDYARSFINNSDILDEERREAFLQTLQELQDVKEEEESSRAIDDEEEFEDAEDGSETPQHDESQANTNGLKRPEGPSHKRTSSEVDYGIEKAHPNGLYSSKPTSPHPTKPGLTKLPPQPEPSGREPSSISRSHLSPPAQTPRRPIRKSKTQAQTGLLSQARQLFTALSNLTRNLAITVTSNPTVVFRMFLFIIAFLMLFSRREIRDRLKRVLGKSWDKLRGTVGMGVKVSYI